MDRDEALRLLNGGEEEVREWNRRRAAVEEIPHLVGAILRRAKLSGADLSGADLSGARLIEADLSEAILSEAVLGRAKLSGAKLSGIYFNRADLLVRV